ncbi:MAG: hypothetical protein MK080_08735 [Opitutales bacterium]|nr:hypothetical protein [Opitutales bacterium]NRA25934.1 DNA photolyase [Opitutales bacterium]
MSSTTSRFSHIYHEPETRNTRLGKHVAEKFPEAIWIPVDHYKDVFNRPGQHFQSQKKSMKLILAYKEAPYLYDGSEQAQDFGYTNFTYNTPIANCLYNCDYCFLQGLYPSGNIVLYVNQEDILEAVDQAIPERSDTSQPLYLALSYNTDLLGFEHLFPVSRFWIEAARARSDLEIEIRTKSSNFRVISDIQPDPSILLAWTLSPDRVYRRYESWTASPKRRLKAARAARDAGWRVRLCIDPAIPIEGWESAYTELLDAVQSSFQAEELDSFSLGTFRMGLDTFKTIRKQRPDSDLYFQQLERKSGLVSLKNEHHQSVVTFIQDRLEEAFPRVPVAVG